MNGLNRIADLQNFENTKPKYMKSILLNLLLVSLVIVVVSCQKPAERVDAQKAQLVELKKQAADINAQIRALETEIAKADPNAIKGNQTLVATLVPGRKEFIRTIDLRGSVESRKNVLLSAEAMGAIQSLPATEGKKVRAGELLVALDGSILQNSIKELDTQIELAKVVYERQENLWKQKIGTEIKYLEAKSTYESLVGKKKTLQAQLNQTRVYAPFDGTVDAVYVKNGEMVSPGLPLVRVINPSDSYVSAEVSEVHLGKFKVGDKVEVTLPGKNIACMSAVKAVSSVINDKNRTFRLEIQIPDGQSHLFKPNQVAVVKIADYKSANAVAVPSDIILSGKSERYVYKVVKNGAGDEAEKVIIQTGESTNGWTEVTAGLDGTEALIVAGHREVSDGTSVRISNIN
mgnify:CR=1 FL=1